MPTNSEITDESLIRRVKYLQRFAGKRKQFDLWKSQTDRQRARNQISGGYSLMIYFFAFSIWQISDDRWFTFDGSLIRSWISPITIASFLIWLVYSTFRLRWAFKAFDAFDVDMVSDIDGKIG